MATDGPTPPKCDNEIYMRGAAIFMTHTIPSNAMEEWVKKVAKESKQRVDWHFIGGRAVVLFLGERAKVRAAIEKLLPEHDELYWRACEQHLMPGDAATDIRKRPAPRSWLNEEG